jgi:transposase
MDVGFDHTVLSEFRTRLVALTAEERLLDAVLALCKEHGWRYPNMGSNELTRHMS